MPVKECLRFVSHDEYFRHKIWLKGVNEKLITLI